MGAAAGAAWKRHVKPLKPLLAPAAIVLAVAILLGWGWIYLARPEHKYRLTIDVQTPGGVRSASGVMAVHMGKDAGLLPGAGGSIGVKGDALFVDLGDGRHLIATLAHGKNAANFDGISRLAMNAFAAAGQKVQFKEVSQLSGKMQVYGDLIPTLVTFTNLAIRRPHRCSIPATSKRLSATVSI